MKAILVAILAVFVFVAAPWGTKEANDNCITHDLQVTVWGLFGYHPDQFYSWRDR